MNRGALKSSAPLWYIVGGVILALSLIARAFSYHVVTSDYTYFVAKWMNDLSAHGFAAFRTPFADYAPLYLYVLKLISYIPVSSLYSSKTLSFVFELISAAFACALLRRADAARFSRGRLFFCYALMLSIPTALINSSLWGQSDALYGAGVMAAAYFIFADRPRGAALAFAAAFSFKVQAIFFLPVLAAYLWTRRKLLYLVLIPALFALSVVPAWLSGGQFDYWFLIYGKQAGEYTGLNLSSASLFAFAPQALSTSLTHTLFVAGVAVAALIAFAVFLLCVRAFNIYRPAPFDIQLLLMLLCVLAVPYFLPRMHERYFYLADIFSFVYALYAPRRWCVALLAVGASLLAYLPYLSQSLPWLAPYVIDLRAPSGLLIAALVLCGIFLLNDSRAAVQQ